MNNQILLRPLKSLLNHKMIIVICLLIGSFLICVPYYVKYSIKSWATLHELEIHFNNFHFSLRPWKIPSFVCEDVTIKNKGPNPTFTQINAKDIFIGPDYIDFFKSYMKDYNFLLKIKALKINMANGEVIEADRISSNVDYKNTIYRISNFNLAPFRIKLDSSLSCPAGNAQRQPCKGHLVIYEIKGEGQYYSVERELSLHVQAPRASSQMPQGKTYAIQGKGKIKFLDLMPYQAAKDPEDPGVRGKITYTIDNFSNLLHHLNQADFISNIAKNLGSILGYPAPRIDPFTQQAEAFTNAVSLDMTFKSDGIYIGPIKL